MGSASRAVSCLCCPCKCLACGLFSCLVSLLISLLVTLALLALILYLIFRPHMITATADSASLSTFSLSSSPTNSALAYNLTVGLTVRNPNRRVGLYYDAVETVALFEGQRFGYDPLDSFYQPTQASTQLKAEFGGSQPLLGDVAAADFRQQQTDGSFDVEVRLYAKLRVKVWAFKVPGPKAKFSCPLSVPAPGANNGAAFHSTDCKFGF